MTDLSAAHQVAASLRRFADSVRPTEIIGYHDDVGTGADLADLLDLGASTIDDLIEWRWAKAGELLSAVDADARAVWGEAPDQVEVTYATEANLIIPPA